MDKKKIAVFSTGWSGEILYEYLKGVRDGLKEYSADIYLFLSFAVFGPSEEELRGELNLYQLPDMKEFDAALVFANGLDYPKVLENLSERFIEADIPVVYTGKEDERFYFSGSDNSIGTRDLATHLIEVHGVKNALFIAGSADNMDSNKRLEAVKEVFEQHGLKIKNENICYTNWSPYVGFSYVRERLEAGEKPDAIICANDTLAMVICNDLNGQGYKVPEDMIVTGFDNEMLAQVYDPSISSVDQRFDNIGRRSANIIIDVFEGREPQKIQRSDCEFIPSESCGCCAIKDFSAIRRKIGKDKFVDRLNNSNFDIKLTTMERVILKGNDFASLRESFSSLNAQNLQYEGSTVHILIDPLVEKTITENQRELRKDGYPDTMNLVYSKDKGYVQNINEFETKKLLPQLNPQGGNRFFIIMPLHEDEYETGYCVLGDDLEKVRDAQMLRKYMERLNIILNRFFQKLKVNALNKRLLQMTETDAMTHVKNRTAFETRLGDLQAKMCSERKPEFAFIIFDINNLKTINDSLGHEAGDDYIINSCRLICKTFKKSAVYRIGGDEFIVILERDDYDARERLLAEMKEEMVRLKTAELPVYEKISIASGLATYNSEEDFNVQEVFNRADAAMYKNKAEMKSGQ